MNLQMVYPLIEAIPFICICVELLKKMLKELEQHKELRKMKESFDSKLWGAVCVKIECIQWYS